MRQCLAMLFSFGLGICYSAGCFGQGGSAQEHYKTVEVYTTAKNTHYLLTHTTTLRLTAARQPTEQDACIFADPAKTLQSIIGFGGALTDAAAETFYKLPPAQQQELLTAYYDQQKGIGYTLARTNMQSCDFSGGSYSYVADGDTALTTFSIAHDMQYKVPLIRQAIAAAGGSLALFASPWSPPAFMKDNNDMLHGGTLLPAYAQSWALMFVKFIEAYRRLGIPIWGCTVQNEPMAVQKWESCVYTAEQERDFIKNHLGPTLAQHGLGDTKLIIWDHNRDLAYHYAATILADEDAAKYVWGTGYHWYETWTGSTMMFDNIRHLAEAFPTKHLLFTEGCNDTYDPARLTDWALGEKYGYSMINDLNCGTEGWTDWNILLDQHGGPNHTGNYCFAPIMADTRTGHLTYTNSYYYIGHFSRFIRPGDKRIISSSNRGQLLTTAFINPQGHLAIIVMNTSDTETNYNLFIAGTSAAITALPHSISTLIVK